MTGLEPAHALNTSPFSRLTQSTNSANLPNTVLGKGVEPSKSLFLKQVAVPIRIRQPSI